MGIVSYKMISVQEYLEKSQLKIPEFQRPYKWTVKNVTRLIDDIISEKAQDRKSYLIGTVVTYREENNSVIQIVDGQQRTITFLLMLKVLLSQNKINDIFLKKELEDLYAKIFNPTFSNDISKKNIYNNYLTIVRRLATVGDDFVLYFLKNCLVTYFEIDNISEAFQFFDAQNARGRDLEPHDLLKAFHLREFSNKTTEQEKRLIIEDWEKKDTDQLSKLFADFLYRVRSWSKGDSSRYFTKKDTDLFKGINLERIEDYPYTTMYQYLDDYLSVSDKREFPFQLDQTIINGEYFFKMIGYYIRLYEDIISQKIFLKGRTTEIFDVIDNYEGMNRTGDKYVRMLFNCALIFFYDKFGSKSLDTAVEKIFIWAYTIRLKYQNLQLVSVDNYVIKTLNLFKIIKESTYSHEIDTLELPLIEDIYVPEKTEKDKMKKVKDLFLKMNYYVERR